MSKYIKLEDAIEQVKTEFYGGGYQEWLEISIDNLINRIANLPTIEVSEDCISREDILSKVYDMDNDDLVFDLKDIEDAPSVVPSITEDRDTQVLDNWQVHHRNTTSAVEDCISREQVRAKLDYISYAEKDPISIAKRIVDNAPSVVPISEQSLMVGEWIEVDDGRVSCKCSICKEEYLLYEEDVFGRNYCPNCGAKMKG